MGWFLRTYLNVSFEAEDCPLVALPSMSNRRTQNLEFKTLVAMEPFTCGKTILEIAADQAIHPFQVSQWSYQLLEVHLICTPLQDDQGQ